MRPIRWIAASALCLALSLPVTRGAVVRPARAADAGRAPAALPAAADAIRRVPRFSGTVRVGGRNVAVTIDTWLLSNGTKPTALPLPPGQIVAELRGGSLITVIDGKRQPRMAGDFWAVPATSRMELETADDSAAVETTVVRQ